MVAGLWSDDSAMQFEATLQFRNLLSIERSPQIEEVIAAGVVPSFVKFLMREDFPQLQFDVAWALTNIASGTSEHTKVVIDHGAVPTFVNLLGSPSDDVREQVLSTRYFRIRPSLQSQVLSTRYFRIRPSLQSQDVSNGAPVASVTEISEIQQTVVEENDVTEVEVSQQHRVFLLGENRWEEPSRLGGKDKPISGSKVGATKCLACRGEGRLLCTGANCPYCEDLGHTICDVCEGRATVQM